MTRICLPVYDGIDLLDVVGPFEIFDWAGFDVDIVAATAGPVKGRANSPNSLGLTVHKTFAEAGPADALWVPGGDPPVLSQLLWGEDHAYLDFLKLQAARSDWVCSVCEGALLLAGAGLLDGYRATTHWFFKPCLGQYFPAVIVDEDADRYVEDRNRLTGAGISAGLDEALRLVEILAGTATAEQVQSTTEYYPQPPVMAPRAISNTCVLKPPSASDASPGQRTT